MSRIGRKEIPVPAGIEVAVDGSTVTVTKGKESVTQTFDSSMKISRNDAGAIVVERPSDDKEHRSLHGLTRTLINNMIVGLDKGYSKELEIVGTGYRAAKQGRDLVMNLGYSHQVVVPEIEGITIEVPAPNKIVIKGVAKQQVGQFAADDRGKRPPEPYKGKGIRYAGEVVKHKEGKAGKSKK